MINKLHGLEFRVCIPSRIAKSKTFGLTSIWVDPTWTCWVDVYSTQSPGYLLSGIWYLISDFTLSKRYTFMSHIMLTKLCLISFHYLMYSNETEYPWIQSKYNNIAFRLGDSLCWCLSNYIPDTIVQCYGCWSPCSCRGHVISSHGIDHIVQDWFHACTQPMRDVVTK